MFEIEAIYFDPEPDFLGIPKFAKPLFFGLHPKYIDGQHFLLTIDYKAALASEATGQFSQDQMQDIARSLQVQPGTKQALDFYTTSVEESKIEQDEVSLRLREHF